MKWICICLAACIVCCPLSYGQSSTRTHVRSFTSFFEDGTLVGSLYGEGTIAFADFERVNLLTLSGRTGFPLGPLFELGFDLNFLNIDPELGNDRSGFSDLGVTGRYLVYEEEMSITAGGSLTLPVGDEDVGQGDVDFSIFGALRYPASETLTVLGTLGIEFLDFDDDYEASLRLGGGVLFQTSENLHILGELLIVSETDFVILSGGIDYRLSSGNKLRTALGLGLDEGAPDVSLILGVLLL